MTHRRPIAATATPPHPSLAVANVCHFPIRANRVKVAPAIIRAMEENGEEVERLLSKRVARVTDWAERPAGFTEQSDEDLRELFGRLAGNQLLFLYLTREDNPIETATEGDTLRSVIMPLMDNLPKEAGIVAAESEPTVGEGDT